MVKEVCRHTCTLNMKAQSENNFIFIIYVNIHWAPVGKSTSFVRNHLVSSSISPACSKWKLYIKKKKEKRDIVSNISIFYLALIRSMLETLGRTWFSSKYQETSVPHWMQATIIARARILHTKHQFEWVSFLCVPFSFSSIFYGFHG